MFFKERESIKEAGVKTSKWWVVSGVLALAILVFGAVGWAVNENVIISIGDGSAPPGGTAIVSLMIRNVTDAAGVSVKITFDENVVQITNPENSDFDFPPQNPIYDRGPGWVVVDAGQVWSPGLNGDVKICDLTLTAVGSAGDTSQLTLVMGPDQGLDDSQQQPIPVDGLDHGTFTITGPPTPPVSTHTIDPAPNAAGWNNTDPVTVNITATDDGGTGTVASIHYILDGGSEVTVAGSSASVSVSGEGTHTVEYWAVDDAGNVETPHNTATVKIDTTPPQITCPGDITQDNAPGQCNAVVTWPAPTATDNTGVASVSCDPTSGSTFPVGVTTVTCTAADLAGNTAQCSFNVTVNDTEDPVISGCPSDITVDNDPGICGAVVTWTEPTASDNCGIESFTSDYEPGDYFPVGTTTVTYTATDIHGNTATCSFDVTVNYLVRVELKNHTGGPLDGGVVEYSSGSWKNFGTTGDSGPGYVEKAFPAGTTNLKIRLSYAGGSQTITQDISVNPIITFQTVEVRARLQDSAGTGIVDGSARYSHGTWIDLGTTNASGNTPGKELLPGDYKICMSYKGKTETHYPVHVVLGGTNQHTEVFQTTTVCLNFSGSIKYSAGSWWPFPSNSCAELLSGSYNFSFDGRQKAIDVTGNKVEKTIVILRLKDHNGSPLSGGTARGGDGSSYTSWHVPGTTDSRGELIDIRDGLHQVMSYEMSYNRTSQAKISQNVATNSYVDFQTFQAIVKLVDHTGGGLAGGAIAFGPSTGNEGWFPGGNTNASGESSAEIFPGTYMFRMQYNNGTEYKQGVVASSPPTQTVVTFQTGLLHWDGKPCLEPDRIKIGSWRFFTKPDMELLPGTYEIDFASSTPSVNQSYDVTAGVVTTIYDKETPTDPNVTSSSHTVGVWSNNPSVVIQVSGASDNCGVDGFEYAWDQNSSWTPSHNKMVEETWTGDTFTATSSGDWYFHLATVDEAGNWTGTVHLGPFKIDAQAPGDPGITGKPPDPNCVNQSIFFAWDAQDSGPSGIDYCEYRLDGGSWARADATGSTGDVYYFEATVATASPLSDGTHTFAVRAWDKAGNVSTIVSYTWLIDTTAPEITNWSVPALVDDYINAGEASVVSLSYTATDSGSGVAGGGWFVASPPESTPCKEGNELVSPPTASHDFSFGVNMSNCPDGYFSLVGMVVDAAGLSVPVPPPTNVADHPVFGYKDTQAPQSQIINGPYSPSNEPDPSFSFEAIDPDKDEYSSGVNKVECRLTGAANHDWVSLTSGGPFTKTLSQIFGYTLPTDGSADGDITFEVRATDNAGNVESTATWTWTYDSTSPQVTAVTVSDDLVTDADAPNKPGSATFVVTIDFNEPIDRSIPPTVTFSPDVSSTLRLHAISSWWKDDDTYVAEFDVYDMNVDVRDIDIQVSSAKDVAGNTQVAYTAADLFGHSQPHGDSRYRGYLVERR